MRIKKNLTWMGFEQGNPVWQCKTLSTELQVPTMKDSLNLH